MKDVFDAYLRYAYRPFDSNNGADIIDSRTYFWMHSYLVKYSGPDKKSLKFITTWFQNADDARRFENQHVQMPYGVNNVDLSVAANACFGIIASVVKQATMFDGIFNDDIQCLLLNTVRLIAHVIENNLLARYEPIILLYYPARFNLYGKFLELVCGLNVSS